MDFQEFAQAVSNPSLSDEELGECFAQLQDLSQEEVDMVAPLLEEFRPQFLNRILTFGV